MCEAAAAAGGGLESEEMLNREQQEPQRFSHFTFNAQTLGRAVKTTTRRREERAQSLLDSWSRSINAEERIITFMT